MDCPQCHLALPTDGDHLKCGKCNAGYHYDCSTVSAKSWRSMGPERKTDWRCVPCKDEKLKRQAKAKDVIQSQEAQLAGSQSSSSGGDDGEDSSKMMEMIGKKLDEFDKKFSGKIDKGFSDLKKEINGKLVDFETTLNFYGDKVDEASKSIKELEKKLVIMEKRLEKSETENGK